MQKFSAVLTALLPLVVIGSLPGGCRAQEAGALPRQEQPTLAGTYVLLNIDGHPVPYAPIHPEMPADAPPPPTIVGSTFTVNPDSTFRLTMSYRMTVRDVAEVVEREFSGTYVREGAGYKFTWLNAGQTPVTLQGDTLILNNEGMLFAYVRRVER
jgi:hypothetical protein